MTFGIVLISFLVLAVSHAAFLLIGWNMAIRADHRLQLSKPDQKPDISYNEIDEIDQERLDYA